MTSGGAGAAATEAAVSLSWRTRPGASPVPLRCCWSLADPTVHRWGLLHLSCSRSPAGELPGRGAEAALLGFDTLISCLRRLSLCSVSFPPSLGLSFLLFPLLAFFGFLQ